MLEIQSQSGAETCTDAIAALDLRLIKLMLCLAKPRGLGWPEAKADSAISQYKSFLLLKSKNRSARIVPSKLVDQVWHQHILDTKKYELDCLKIFGGTLHHNPYLGLQGDVEAWEDAVETTRTLYAKEFGGRSSDRSDAAGCDAADIRPAGCDAADIELAGCDAADLTLAGCDAADVGRAGCDAADITAAGCDAADISTVGYSTAFSLAGGSGGPSASPAR